jgi:hypothetical protein
MTRWKASFIHLITQSFGGWYGCSLYYLFLVSLAVDAHV